MAGELEGTCGRGGGGGSAEADWGELRGQFEAGGAGICPFRGAVEARGHRQWTRCRKEEVVVVEEEQEDG